MSICAFLSATPAVAQDTVTGAPAGTAPATVEGYGYSAGAPGYGYNGAPAYGYGYGYPYGYGYAPGYVAPLGPVGAAAAGVFGAAATIGAATVGAPVVPAPVVTAAHPRCAVWHDWNGRYTALCGP